MRILFDITHPANVHLFKHLIRQLVADGAQVAVASRQKDVTTDLLASEGIDHVCLTHSGAGLLGLGAEARPSRMPLWTGEAIPAGRAGGCRRRRVHRPRRMPDENPPCRLRTGGQGHAPEPPGLPLATTICTGSGYRLDHGRRHVRFRGFQHRRIWIRGDFILTPRCFAVAGDAGGTALVIRLVGWAAAHDLGVASYPWRRFAMPWKGFARWGAVPSVPSCLCPPRCLRGNARSHLRTCTTCWRLLACAWQRAAPWPWKPGCWALPLSLATVTISAILRAAEEWGVIRRVDSLPQALELAAAMAGQQDIKDLWQRRAAALYESTDDVLKVMGRTIEQAVQEREGCVEHDSSCGPCKIVSHAASSLRSIDP